MLAVALASSGCAAVDPREEIEGGSLPEGEALPEGTTLDAVFARAAADFDVPDVVLKAIAWAETRAEMLSGDEEHEGMPPAYGMMALRGAELEKGAALIGLSVEEVESEIEPNVRAAAALLGFYADQHGFDRDDVASWAWAVADLSGIESLEARINYVYDEVYAVLHEGVVVEGFNLEPMLVMPSYLALDAQPKPGPDYGKSIWHPSPNYSSRPATASGKPQMVIIHSCEGSYSGCWGWLASSKSGVSAHYVVNTTGSEISQLVLEAKKAWHIAATYKCSLNGGTSCSLNGSGGNNFTVGIEHAGFAKQSSWAEGLLTSSAKLVCDISKGHNIPIDQYHVVAHGKLQPYNRIDPGPNWPWGKYLALADDYCSGAAPQPPPAQPPPAQPPAGPFSIVVDTNNGKNGSGAEFKVGSSWTASSNVGGYYNTGYYWRSTGASSDLAEFRAYLPAAKKLVVEAWWTAAKDRSPKAPFLVFDAKGSHLDTVVVDQQKNGSQWVALGTYTLPAGWNKVALSRWTGDGYVVVADAVRLREP